MNPLQFDDPKDQYKAVGEIFVAQDEQDRPSRIVDSAEDWYVRAKIDFAAVPKEVYKIVFRVYFEALDTNNDISDPALFDGQEWLSQKQHYDFQVHMKENSVPTGVYRVSAVISLQDENKKNLAVAFEDVGLIQVFQELN